MVWGVGDGIDQELYLTWLHGERTGPEVIKLFSSSAQLSMKFQLLINVEIVTISGQLRFKTKKLVIYPAYKC